MTSAIHPNIPNENYSYDPLGRRIQKNVNGNITEYIYDNEDIILEYDGNNNITASYTHGPGIDEPLILDKQNNKYYYHTDGLGSVTAITDSNNNIVQTYQYDSFGNIINQTGSLTQPYTYTGREYDPETGLYYYRARYYDPKIGRFLQEDPIWDINLYTYVTNNPINKIDSLGLKDCKNELEKKKKELKRLKDKYENIKLLPKKVPSQPDYDWEKGEEKPKLPENRDLENKLMEKLMEMIFEEAEKQLQNNNKE